MACLGIFGRGPGGGDPTALRRALKDTPDVLRDIYSLAGIVPFTPVSTGAINFRYGGGGTADSAFVCPEPTCRRHLPTHVSQLDHNVPAATLVGNLGQPHLPLLNHINVNNFIHRNETNSNQYRNFVVNPAVAGYGGAGFAVYYIFTTDVFDLVMQVGGNGWMLRVARINWASLHNVIRTGFTLAAAGGNFNLVPSAGALGAGLGPLTPTALAPYQGNLAWINDLANLQFMCGPCNASKNAGGNPLQCFTHF